MAKVLYEKRNRIGYITLNRPDALNALDDELNSELWTVWDDFARDESLDVGILTGAGKAFCSGADLKTFIPKWEKGNMLDVRRNVPTGIGGGITRGQHRITKPIIAAVNGHAIGGGFELALACDIRIASEKAKFGVFEVRYGLHQGDGGIVRLVAIAGIATALELTLTGREVTAEEAFFGYASSPRSSHTRTSWRRRTNTHQGSGTTANRRSDPPRRRSSMWSDELWTTRSALRRSMLTPV